MKKLHENRIDYARRLREARGRSRRQASTRGRMLPLLLAVLLIVGLWLWPTLLTSTKITPRQLELDLYLSDTALQNQLDLAALRGAEEEYWSATVDNLQAALDNTATYPMLRSRLYRTLEGFAGAGVDFAVVEFDGRSGAFRLKGETRSATWPPPFVGKIRDAMLFDNLNYFGYAHETELGEDEQTLVTLPDGSTAIALLTYEFEVSGEMPGKEAAADE